MTTTPTYKRFDNFRKVATHPLVDYQALLDELSIDLSPVFHDGIVYACCNVEDGEYIVIWKCDDIMYLTDRLANHRPVSGIEVYDHAIQASRRTQVIIHDMHEYGLRPEMHVVKFDG